MRIYKAFFDLWEGLRAWHQDQIRRVHQDGYITSPLGRVRRLPGIWDGNDKLVSFSERAAINSPVQGMASDLMQMAAASMQGLLPGSTAIRGFHPVATVHDSIVGEVRIRDWQDIVAQAQERMTNLDHVLRKMGVDFNVPLKADATVGTRWSLDDVSNPKEMAA